MAKLPDSYSLGESPVPQSRAPVLSPSNPGVAERAMQQTSPEIDKAISAFAKIGEQMQMRDEAIDELRTVRRFREAASALASKTIADGDLTDPNTAKEFSKTLDQLEAESLGNMRGRPESRIRAAGDLQRMRFDLVGNVATASAKAHQEMIGSELNGYIGELSLGVFKDPGRFESAMTEFQDRVQRIPGSPEFKAKVNDQALATFALAGVKQMVATGAIRDVPGAMNDAMDILEHPRVAAALGPRLGEIMQEINAKAKSPGRILTTAETRGMGFPPNVIVQKKADGNYDVLYKPDSEKDGTRDRKIADLVAQGVDPVRAQRLVDGHIRTEIVPSLGVAREVDAVGGTAREVPLAQAEPQFQTLADSGGKRSTLYEIAASGAIAGAAPAVEEFYARTFGQLPGVNVNTKVVQLRQELTTASSELIRALSINPRFPVGEVDRIKEEVKIAPSMLDSTPALTARMRGIDSSLRIRLENETRAAADTSLPQETRTAASQASKDIKNFLDRLGAKDQPEPQQGSVGDLTKRVPKEGDTATNQSTGAKLIFKGGKWEPVDGGQ